MATAVAMLGVDVVDKKPPKSPEGEESDNILQRSQVPTTDSMERESNGVNFMDGHHAGKRNSSLLATLLLAYQTIGVVYGDLGTSPLYVYSSVFTNPPSKNEVLGALSIIIYTLTLISLIKYVFIVLQANDNGNGGAFALYSLICRHAKIPVANNQISEDEISAYKIQKATTHILFSTRIKEALQRSCLLKRLLLSTTILGTCMVIGDGVLTPSISVLSAIQGIKIAVPSISQDVVVGVTCVILLGIFSLQRFGTDKVGHLFSPVVLLWFTSIGAIGLYDIVKHGPEVFKAFNPYYIYIFFKKGKVGWTSLGSIVLCITDHPITLNTWKCGIVGLRTEAMFADLGHFSVRAIQIAFSTIVYPCLLTAYIGQAAYIMIHPENVSNTFYESVPDAVFWPMFTVATSAAIIASQAMISATFSIVYQAMNLGCFPRVKVVHTSSKHFGQVYIPEINWLIMTLCIIIAAAFRNTSQIGNAYGVAVSADMVITTHLVTLVMIMIWQKPLWLTLIFYCIVSLVEISYLSSVLIKIPKGGWVSIVFVGMFFIIMSTWHYGKSQKYAYEMQNKVPMDLILGLGPDLGMLRVPGIGLVYTELGSQGVPTIFHHLLSRLPAMPSVLAFVCVKYLPVSHVPDKARILVRRLGPQKFRLYRCAVRFGYKELIKDGEHSESFENLLVQSLFKFIKAEHGQSPELQDANNSEDLNSVDVQIEDKMLGFQDTEASPELEHELAVLDTAMQSGIVHLLGHTEIRARKDSSWLKKLVVNYGFHTLKVNCRSSKLSLSIPHAKLLQVGMIHDL